MTLQSGTVFDISLEAASDLSTKQFYAVKINSAGKAALADDPGIAIVGVLQNKPTAGQAALVRVLGSTKWIAAGVIAPGAIVAVDTDGKATTASAGIVDTQAGSATDPVIGSYVAGIARNAANSAAGDLIEVVLLHMGAAPTTAA